MGRMKYKNIKTTVDGIKFDSKLEARRYKQLKLLQRAKQISNLELQPKFIFPIKYSSGRKITYIADFSYTEHQVTVIEDAKGVRTAVYKIKKAMMKHFFDINVIET